jgi:hypothetical protein
MFAMINFAEAGTVLLNPGPSVETKGHILDRRLCSPEELEAHFF